MIRVLVGTEAWTLDPKRTIGAGGEAIVVAHGKGKQRCALKLFRDPSDEKRAKIERLMTDGPWPACVVAPTAIASEPGSGRTLGFTMPLVEGVEPVALLAKPAARAARGLGKKRVAEIMTRLGEALGAIHVAGLVVGDLNDQNELFDERGNVWFIDADSFQVGELPCVVASEHFLDPQLYGPDASQPCVSPTPRRFDAASDWYAFAVIAFRSLTGIHPFGGAHATLTTIPARARARVAVFDPSVNLPAPAREGLATLGRDLRERFEACLVGGERGAFDLRAIRTYATEIVKCACGLELPASALPCPRCAPLARVAVPAPPSRVRVRELGRAHTQAEGAALDGVYTIVRGWLFADTTRGVLPVTTVLEGQARIATNPRAEGCVVAEQRFGERTYRFARRMIVVDLDVPPLARAERAIDEALAVGDGAVAVLRITSRAGELRFRSSWFAFGADRTCPVVASHALDTPVAGRAAGDVIEGGLLVRSGHLVATDRGLVREDLSGRDPSVEFACPPGVVREGTRLSLSSEGLVAVTGERAFALEVA